MSETKTQERLKAEHIVNRVWLARVFSVAEHCLSRTDRSPLTIYPPTEREYKECERALSDLEPKSELSLAMPASEPVKTRKRRT